MSVADKARKVVQDMTGMWWPAADEGGLRDAAKAWRAFADDVDDVTAGANKAARSIIEHNKGEAISAFDDPFWRRYYHGGHGWLKDLADAARDMAKALDAYADAVHGAKKNLEHELEIVGATLVAGTALAIFTAGISEGAAVAAAATVTELAAGLGVAVTEEIAAIAGTTLATASFAGVESITVDLAVTQPVSIALGEQKDGLSLDEARQAGAYGALTGGLLGGAGATYRAAGSGGLSSFFDGIDIDLASPRMALAGVSGDLSGISGDLAASDRYAMRVGAGGAGGGAGKGPWPAASGIKGPAAGKDLKPPHPRHTIAGAGSGEVKEVNSVVLRGYEQDINQDVADIAAGRGTFDKVTNRYEINGRTYGVEDTGRVYPDSGKGVAKLDRNEYAALQQIVKAKGDIDAAPQLTRNPRFTKNPGVVQKALEIYNGTYPP
ncbi:WXG100-like domain-containing protein [Streptomyces sp. NPDC004596]|uniref:WXG100-like domain-containing protein n=1 Tax=Streptomyces sp. DSM 118148 TaxID=3448667 RepID=UPI00404026C3